MSLRGRAEKVKAANRLRQSKVPNHVLAGESCDTTELEANPSLALSYIVAKPRMALYLDYSTRIYEIYLRYISADDIHSYSVDEVLHGLLTMGDVARCALGNTTAYHNA